MRFSVVAAVTVVASCTLPTLAAPFPSSEYVLVTPLRRLALILEYRHSLFARDFPGGSGHHLPGPRPRPRPRPRDFVELEERGAGSSRGRGLLPTPRKPRDFVELEERNPPASHRPHPFKKVKPRDYIELESRYGYVPLMLCMILSHLLLIVRGSTHYPHPPVAPRPHSSKKSKPRDYLGLEEREFVELEERNPPASRRPHFSNKPRPREFMEFDARYVPFWLIISRQR